MHRLPALQNITSSLGVPSNVNDLIKGLQDVVASLQK